MKRFIIPIFIPHKGCKYNCIFCNQHHITGKYSTNISIEHEKYNLTASNVAQTTLTQVDSSYTNLTQPIVVEDVDFLYRRNDITNEAINFTYWRIYVPLGVAGTCEGNIVFGASLA